MIMSLTVIVVMIMRKHKKGLLQLVLLFLAYCVACDDGYEEGKIIGGVSHQGHCVACDYNCEFMITFKKHKRRPSYDNFHCEPMLIIMRVMP